METGDLYPIAVKKVPDDFHIPIPHAGLPCCVDRPPLQQCGFQAARELSRFTKQA
jgi:hypothetical protein